MESLVRIGKALSDESRLRALALLEPGELCLCQLIEVIGLAPSTVSKHMQLLVDAGLVQQRKEGRWRFYRLAEPNETSGPVAGALAWLGPALKDLSQVERDRRHRNDVVCRDRGELTACYRS